MFEKQEVKNGITQAIEILREEQNRIGLAIELLEGKAKIREVDDGPSEGIVPAGQEKQKPRKKPQAKMKRSYIPTHKHISG